MSDWKSIETAPRDGQKYLAYSVINGMFIENKPPNFTLESGIGMKNADLGVVTRMRMQELQPIGRHYPHHQRKIHENPTPAP